MKYNLTLLKHINRMLTAGVIYTMIFSILLTVYEEAELFSVYMLGIYPILIGYLLIEQYVFHSVAYILLHGAFVIPVFVIDFPFATYRYLYLFLLFYENVHAYTIWRRNTEKPYTEAPWGIYLAFALVFMIAEGYHYDNIATLVFAGELLLLVLHFTRTFLEGIDGMIKKSHNATSIPTRKIVFTSGTLIGFVILAFLIAAICVRAFELNRYLALVGRFLIRIIRAVAGVILYVTTLLRALFATESTVEKIEEQQEDLFAALEELSEPSMLARILHGIIILAFIAFVIYGLYRLYQKLYRIFLQRYTLDRDIVTTLKRTPEHTGTNREEQTFIKKIRTILTTDNRAKIRIAYRKKIAGYKEYSHKKSHTPKDIQNEIETIYKEDIADMTALYEKARYSDEEITNEDVKQGGVL